MATITSSSSPAFAHLMRGGGSPNVVYASNSPAGAFPPSYGVGLTPSGAVGASPSSAFRTRNLTAAPTTPTRKLSSYKWQNVYGNNLPNNLPTYATKQLSPIQQPRSLTTPAGGDQSSYAPNSFTPTYYNPSGQAYAGLLPQIASRGGDEGSPKRDRTRYVLKKERAGCCSAVNKCFCGACSNDGCCACCNARGCCEPDRKLLRRNSSLEALQRRMDAELSPMSTKKNAKNTPEKCC